MQVIHAHSLFTYLVLINLNIARGDVNSLQYQNNESEMHFCLIEHTSDQV